MKEWLEGFYSDPDLRDTLLRSFLPVFSSYVEAATGGPVAASFVQALAESYVDRHLGSSRAQLQEVVGGSDNPLADLTARFEEWEAKRPEKVAKNELIRSANAAQVQQMREAGVEKMVWRASGGACPFCNELDGVIISVNGTFFEAGDELNPEGVTAPIHFESTIGHPPVHQGCSCFVEAVTETETGDSLPALPVQTEAAITDFAEQFAQADREHAAIIDATTGEVVERLSGGTHSVSTGRAGSWAGKVDVHNHPDGGSFSWEDFVALLDRDPTEMRVINPDGGQYRIAVAGPLEVNGQTVDRSDIRRAFDFLRNQEEQMSIEGQIPSNLRMHHTWTEIAKLIPSIRYERRP